MQAVLHKIKSMTRGHIVYPGLAVFRDRKPGEEVKLNKHDVPGLAETSWDPAVDALYVCCSATPRIGCLNGILMIRLRQPRRNPYHGTLQLILDDLQNDKSAWPFAKPVDTSVVMDYDKIILEPMGESHPRLGESHPS